MSKQDEQFNTSSLGDKQSNSTQPYEYVFSTGEMHRPHRSRSNRNGSRFLFSVILVLLCAVISFSAGFGGAFYAHSLLEADSDAAEEATDTTNPNDLPLHDDPESILEKNDNSTPTHGSAGDEVFSVSEVVKIVQDAVVVIDVTFNVESFFGTQTSSGAGSGVLISADGYILTCHHVVADESAKTKSIRVTLNSGAVYNATLVGADAGSDLAVIKIEPKNQEQFVYAEHGRSDRLVVGEHVVAIGNPLGTLGGSVTDGIISATERTIQTSDGTNMTLLQTNAAINSGNSGGGLFNLDGQLIGIVNAKYAAQGVEGLAFAIPIDSAYEVELELIQYGYVRGIVDHGLEVWDVTAENLRSNYYYYNIKTIGVYVMTSSFNEDLQYKDRIVSVNGIEIKTGAELNAVVEEHRVGEKLSIVYERDGVTYTTELTVGEYVPDYIKENSAP